MPMPIRIAVFISALLVGLVGCGYSFTVYAAEEGKVVSRDWTFDGVFGYYDKASLQRGFKVYREVCAACHGLEYVAFRDFAGLGYSADEIKAIASEYEVEDGPNDEGEYFTRVATAADKIPNPFANENAARAANNGAYPVDLSLIVKARRDGANYLYSLLTSYIETPPNTDVPEGMHFNIAFSGNMIAMPQPLYGDDVSFEGAVDEKGNPLVVDTSMDALAADTVAFLAWASEPKMETRKRSGIAVMLFLLVLCFVSYGAMQHTWAEVKPKKKKRKK